MEDFITVAQFTFSSDYAVLELLLQQAEIRYVFLNETVTNVLPFHSNAFGGIRLQVYKEDKEQTIQIIKDLNKSSFLKIV